MYITVNGSTYQNAVRVKSAQAVAFSADGLAGVVAAGVVALYRDDGFEIGSDMVENYLRQEATESGFTLTNIPVPQPVEPAAELVDYDEMTSTINAVKLLVASGTIPATTDEARITVSGLYPEWTEGSHTAGEVYNTNGQTWECFQAYNNAVYPDINPGNSAWFTFNRPLHGKSKETAREFVRPTHSLDQYFKDEWMIYDGSYWLCLRDTSYSPDDDSTAWENKGV